MWETNIIRFGRILLFLLYYLYFGNFLFLIYCKYYHIFIHLIYGCSFVAMAAGGKREKIKRGTFFKHAQRWWYWLKTKVKISPRAHADGGALSWTLDTNEFQCLNLPSMWSEESFLLALGHRTKCSLSRSGVRYPTWAEKTTPGRSVKSPRLPSDPDTFRSLNCQLS